MENYQEYCENERTCYSCGEEERTKENKLERKHEEMITENEEERGNGRTSKNHV